MIANNNYPANPIIYDPEQIISISFAQTRDTLIDTEIYSRFVYSCENNFKHSKFYKGYKCDVMNKGLFRDQNMASITSEMAEIELHHNFPTLKQATIMIIEHLLNTKGCVTTFEVIRALEEAHRNNWMGIIMLTKTQHEKHHADSIDFISLSQCYGDPFKFLEYYMDGMTLDISYKLLLHLKLEVEHNGESYNPSLIKARDEILCWQINNGVRE
jgi:hypothetical protein